MKITILTQYYPPEFGAPARIFAQLANCLAERGHEVTVLTAQPNYPTGQIYEGYGGLLTQETQGKINVIRTYIKPSQEGILQVRHRILKYLSFVFSSLTAGTFMLPETDYLMVVSPPLLLGLSGLWLNFLKGSRLIFNVSDLHPESAVRLGVMQKNSMAFRLSELLEKTCYQKAWLVTGATTEIVKDIQTRFPMVSTFHLSNGVNTNEFQPQAAINSECKLVSDLEQFKNRNREFIVCYSGLHGIAQDLSQIIEAAQILKKEKYRFVFVGEGVGKQHLQAKVKSLNLSNVSFYPAQCKTNLPGILCAADVVVIPLKTHLPGAVPSKTYEAMACGKPIVMLACGEAADLVEKHRLGFAVRPNDTAGLVTALRELKANPILCTQFGQNGRRVSEEIYDHQKIYYSFIDFLEENLENTKFPVETKDRAAQTLWNANNAAIDKPVMKNAFWQERKLFVFDDQIYSRSGEKYSAHDAFPLFALGFHEYFKSVKLCGRLFPTARTGAYVIPSTQAEVCALPYYDNISALLSQPWRYFPRIIRILRRELRKSDVVWLSWPHPISLLAIVLLKVLGIKKVTAFLVVRGDVEGQVGWHYKGVKRRIATSLLRFLEWQLSFSDRETPLFAVGKALTQIYQQRRKNVFSIEISLLQEKNLPEPKMWAAHVRKAPMRLLFVGRCDPEKGLPILLQAVSLLSQEGQDIELDVVGTGREEEQWRSMAREMKLEAKTRFHGYVPFGSDLFSLYYDADIFVLPSFRGEGVPQVILEAMAIGLPIVASNVGGVGGVIRHNENGLLCEPHSVENLADRIRLLLSDAEFRQKLGQHAAREIHAHTMELQLQKILAVLASYTFKEKS